MKTKSLEVHKEYKQVYNKVRKLTCIIPEAQCEVVKQCESNSEKKFYKYVSNKSKSQSKIGDIKTDDTDKMSMWLIITRIKLISLGIIYPGCTHKNQ